jgi:uncharacterized membrane protein
MTPDRKAGMDKRLELIIGYTLRVGVVTAAVIVLVGGIVYLVQNHSAMPHYRTFQASSHSDDLSGVVRNVLAFNSLGIIQLGLLILIVTPILRVLLSVVAFALERDLLYVGATLIVLAILLYSLLVQGL